MKRTRALHGESTKCALCGTTAHGIPGRRHRRCGGSTGASVREKRAERLPAQERGKWQAGVPEMSGDET